MKKRLVSFVLAVCLLVGVLPLMANAAEKTYWFENIKASVDGTHVIVTGDGI